MANSSILMIAKQWEGHVRGWSRFGSLERAALAIGGDVDSASFSSDEARGNNKGEK